jgi:hypothetical protein
VSVTLAWRLICSYEELPKPRSFGGAKRYYPSGRLSNRKPLHSKEVRRSQEAMAAATLQISEAVDIDCRIPHQAALENTMSECRLNTIKDALSRGAPCA